MRKIGGYVLAGGRSSRMGQEKALLELAGRPLIEHAVTKLRRLCMEVHVLSARAELSCYAPLVADLHPGCGPLGGMEAGLAHSNFEWNLFLAVDMPFLPATVIDEWVSCWLSDSPKENLRQRVHMLSAGGRPQPGFCLIHREARPYLTAALNRGEYKLLPALEAAGMDLTQCRVYEADDRPCKASKTDSLACLDDFASEQSGMSHAQKSARQLWFANLNTPTDLEQAERHLDALDS